MIQSAWGARASRAVVGASPNKSTVAVTLSLGYSVPRRFRPARRQSGHARGACAPRIALHDRHSGLFHFLNRTGDISWFDIHAAACVLAQKSLETELLRVRAVNLTHSNVGRTPCPVCSERSGPAIGFAGDRADRQRQPASDCFAVSACRHSFFSPSDFFAFFSAGFPWGFSTRRNVTASSSPAAFLITWPAMSSPITASLKVAGLSAL